MCQTAGTIDLTSVVTSSDEKTIRTCYIFVRPFTLTIYLFRDQTAFIHSDNGSRQQEGVAAGRSGKWPQTSRRRQWRHNIISQLGRASHILIGRDISCEPLISRTQPLPCQLQTSPKVLRAAICKYASTLQKNSAFGNLNYLQNTCSHDKLHIGTLKRLVKYLPQAAKSYLLRLHWRRL